MTLVLDFKVLENFKANLRIPAQVVLEPDGTFQQVLQLRRVNDRKGGNYNYLYYFFKGKTDVKPDNFTYYLPYEHDTKQLVGQGYNGKFSHKGIYALDFNLKEGTKVCAARGGIVVELKEDSSYGCKSSSCQGHANYLIIYHEDGTFSYYAHLQKNGVLVKLGDTVKAGQVVALSGNTGWSSGPHLHFEVFKPLEKGKQTLPVTFHEQDGPLQEIKTGKSYTANHQ
jgi:murein DD-endopeptidase MepM/ murein hydrolase activator NlpD